LVSVSFGGGGLQNSGLGLDAQVQFSDFLFQLVSLGFQMLDGGF
jgi:hypothetical protein